MSATVRPAKSGLDWNEIDLLYFKIIIDGTPATKFFCLDSSSAGTGLDIDLSHLDPAFLHLTDTLATVEAASDGAVLTTDYNPAPAPQLASISDQTFYLLKFLELASWAGFGQEFAVEDFARELLRTLGFQTRSALLRTRYPIPMLVSGETRTTPIDISLVGTNSSMVLLLLQKENPVSLYARDPVPQLVAAAISAFYANNRARSDRGKPALEKMIFPGIVMVRTRPTFFTIPVTAALSLAVATGTSPKEATHVARCVVPWPRVDEGMEVPAFRETALKHFIAFKALAESLWSKY